MSVLGKESIKVIAEARGIPPLSDDIAAAMVGDVEYRIREIVQEAIKFMRHSKRNALTTDDISSALRLRNVEPLYGYMGNTPMVFRRAAGTSDLYYVEEKTLSLNEVISQPLPKCPRDVAINCHWLAVEGVQPNISQNPPVHLRPSLIEGASKEKPSMDPNNITLEAANIGNDTSQTQSTESGKASNSAVVRHTLSTELQLYYEKITDALLSRSQQLQKLAISSLEEDAGINQLLPYFSKFITTQVTKNLKDLQILTSLVSAITALLRNTNLNTGLYLQQLVPAILTTLLGKRLSASPTENHWELRDQSALTLKLIVDLYASNYKTLKPRIIRTLINAFLSPAKPLPTHYGAIKGLTEMGPQVICSLLLPNLEAYIKLLQPSRESTEPIRKEEAEKVFLALRHACGTFLTHVLKIIQNKNIIENIKSKLTENAEKPESEDKLAEANSGTGAASNTGNNGLDPKAKKGAAKARGGRKKRRRGEEEEEEETESAVNEADAGSESNAGISTTNLNAGSSVEGGLSGDGETESNPEAEYDKYVFCLPGGEVYYDLLREIFGEGLLPYLTTGQSSNGASQAPLLSLAPDESFLL